MSGSITTAYQSIAPYKLYLNLTDSEINFSSGLKDKPSNLKSYNKMNLDEYMRINDSSLSNCENTNNSNCNKPPYNNDIFEKLTNDDRFNIFFNEIIKNNLNKIVSSSSITLFVPIQNVNLIYDFKNYPRKILLNHIVDGIINPIDIIDRKVTIKMMSGSILTMNRLQIFDDSKNKNRVLQSINCDNAYIYVIENPIVLNIV